MAVSYKNRFLAVMRDNETRMARIFSELAQSLASEVTRRADAAGHVPRAAVVELGRAIDNRVTDLFIGWGGNGQRMPFDQTPNGIFIPLSPYTRALWAGIQAAARLPVEQNAGLMQARLPVDLWAQLSRATVSPFAVARGQAVAEQAFKPNPMATYDAPHSWVDPAGYRLSDRIWNTTAATRRRLDQFMDSQIAQGRGAAAIAKDLEIFLQPGRKLMRTNAPYGTDASYDAMRLARTEIARAHAGAAEQSSLMNPFVTGLAVRLSGSHPKKDICDDAVADGPWPKDEIPHKYRVPLHPHCLCTYRYVMAPADQQQKLIDEVRTVVVDARHKFADLVGPAAVEEFTNLLLRGGLNLERLTPGVGVPPVRPGVAIPTPAALVRTITGSPLGAAPAQSTTAPVAPAAEAAPVKVSAGMQGPKAGANKAINDRVAAAIDGIHNDGDLAPVPVKFAKMSSRHGHYKSQGRAPIEIKISTQSPHPHQTLAHEVGHWIDGQKVGISRAAQQHRPEEMPERFKEFFDAVRGSEAFNVLTELRMGKRKLEYINAGKVMQLPADYKYLTYVLRAEELWARAYAQYVAVRSRDPVLLAELAADQAGRAYPVQWSDADFEPIAAAIDQILAFVGWR